MGKHIVYNKLVRDRIPEIIRETGKIAEIRVLDDSEYLTELDRKLQEEMAEYLENGSIDELADLIEVVYAVLEHKKVTLNDFESIRLNKAVKRGAFRDRIFLKEVIED